MKNAAFYTEYCFNHPFLGSWVLGLYWTKHTTKDMQNRVLKRGRSFWNALLWDEI